MLFLSKSWVLVYGDGEGTGEGEGEGTAKPKPTLQKLIEEHGLQEELNSIMAKNRKGLTQKNQELVTQLTELRDKATMSTQAKEELEARIEELQTQYMSKEELARREAEKASKTHGKEVEKLTGDAKKWQKLYATSTTQRALIDAAIKGKALGPAVQQIAAILGPDTHIVEELDDSGQGKGSYKTIVKFNDVDADGKPVVLDLSPTDAVKRMKELTDLYGNLFEGEATGGLGASGGGGGKGERPIKLDELLKDPAKFRKWRKENPDFPIDKLRSA